MSVPVSTYLELVSTFENTRRLWRDLGVAYAHTLELERYDGHYRITVLFPGNHDREPFPHFENMGSAPKALAMMSAAQQSAAVITLALYDLTRQDTP
jgi:hypothetical protein